MNINQVRYLYMSLPLDFYKHFTLVSVDTWCGVIKGKETGGYEWQARSVDGRRIQPLAAVLKRIVRSNFLKKALCEVPTVGVLSMTQHERRLLHKNFPSDETEIADVFLYLP